MPVRLRSHASSLHFANISFVGEQPGASARVEPEAAQPMFRAMKEDADGFPVIGRSSRTLGVRIEGPFRDIPVAVDGSVAPRTGGMSVALDAAQNLPKPRIPKSLGGEGRDPIFQMTCGSLPLTLIVRKKPYPHAYVEPRSRCPLAQFESALASTRHSWSKTHE